MIILPLKVSPAKLARYIIGSFQEGIHQKNRKDQKINENYP